MFLDHSMISNSYSFCRDGLQYQIGIVGLGFHCMTLGSKLIGSLGPSYFVW